MLRRAAIWVIAIILAAIAVIGVLLSPLLLRRISNTSGFDWQKLSYVGQTYSGVSAIIAAVALVGVGISIILTVRQGKTAQENAVRALHLDLLRTSLQTDSLLECWGAVGSETENEGRARHIYTNLILSHWQMAYEIGALTEIELREMCRGLFQGEVALRFWTEARDLRTATSVSRRSQRFHSIVDDEYIRANSDPITPSDSRGVDTPNVDKLTALIDAIQDDNRPTNVNKRFEVDDNGSPGISPG